MKGLQVRAPGCCFSTVVIGGLGVCCCESCAILVKRFACGEGLQLPAQLLAVSGAGLLARCCCSF